MPVTVAGTGCCGGSVHVAGVVCGCCAGCVAGSSDGADSL